MLMTMAFVFTFIIFWSVIKKRQNGRREDIHHLSLLSGMAASSMQMVIPLHAAIQINVDS